MPKLSDSFFDETGSFTLNESNCENEKCEVESVDTDEVLAKIKDIRIEHRKECVISCLYINSLQNKFNEGRLWLATNTLDILTIESTQLLLAHNFMSKVLTFIGATESKAAVAF